MNDAYAATVVLLLAATALPAWALVFFLKPKPLKYVMRGGYAVLPFAFGVDFTRRLLFILSGYEVHYPEKAWHIPGDVWAVFNILLLSLVMLLVWARLDQVLRHLARNKQFVAQGKADLLARGIDIDAEIEEQQKAGEQP